MALIKRVFWPLDIPSTVEHNFQVESLFRRAVCFGWTCVNESSFSSMKSIVISCSRVIWSPPCCWPKQHAPTSMVRRNGFCHVACWTHLPCVMFLILLLPLTPPSFPPPLPSYPKATPSTISFVLCHLFGWIPSWICLSWQPTSHGDWACSSSLKTIKHHFRHKS